MLVGFYEQVKRQFEQAVATKMAVFHTIVLAKSHIRLCFAGETLPPHILPALAHLLQENPTSTIDLTIYLWESVSTGVLLPPAPWSQADYLTRREVRGMKQVGLVVNYDVGAGVFSMLNCDEKTAVWWVHDVAKMPDYERAAPLRTILQQWFSEQEGQFIHVAAVGNALGGVLLAGPGGAGKSTTALAAISLGLSFAGEDYCLLTGATGDPIVHCVYNSAKLSEMSLAWMPHFAPLLMNPNRTAVEKGILQLYPTYGEQMALALPIRAILIPQVVEMVTQPWSRTKGSRALKALAPSTIFQLSAADATVLRRLTALVRRVPCFDFYLSRDLAQVVQGIEEVLQEVVHG